jgi:hypothetical protein
MLHVRGREKNQPDVLGPKSRATIVDFEKIIEVEGLLLHRLMPDTQYFGTGTEAPFTRYSLIALMPSACEVIFVFDMNPFSAGLPALEDERSPACLAQHPDDRKKGAARHDKSLSTKKFFCFGAAASRDASASELKYCSA